MTGAVWRGGRTGNSEGAKLAGCSGGLQSCREVSGSEMGSNQRVLNRRTVWCCSLLLWCQDLTVERSGSRETRAGVTANVLVRDDSDLVGGGCGGSWKGLDSGFVQR